MNNYEKAYLNIILEEAKNNALDKKIKSCEFDILAKEKEEKIKESNVIEAIENAKGLSLKSALKNIGIRMGILGRSLEKAEKEGKDKKKSEEEKPEGKEETTVEVSEADGKNDENPAPEKSEPDKGKKKPET